MRITVEEWKRIFLNIAEKVEEQKDYLSELDRAVGDGDHGITMSVGWQAVKEKLEQSELTDCGEVCKLSASAFLNAVGSSVGPLYATAFLRGAAVLQGKKELEDKDIVDFWVAAVKGIQERGKAQVGDKTMVDTWVPAVDALVKAHEDGKVLDDCLNESVKAGEKGMKATKDMISKLGRSSRLGKRCLGHQDPGATSAYIILTAFAYSIRQFQKV